MKLTSFTNRRIPVGKIAGMFGALGVLLVPYVLYRIKGIGSIAYEQSVCPFKMLTGFPCPGCGITKSLIFLYAGEWGQSIHFHLFGPLVWLGALLIVGWMLGELVTGSSFRMPLLYNSKLAYGLAIALAVYHLVRLFVFVREHNFDSILRESIWK